MNDLTDDPARGEAAEETRVGCRRPPVATRFRPGSSGNPRGRPRGARNLGAIIASALGEKVQATEDGRTRRISKFEAAIKQLANRAATGDPRATQMLIGLVQANEARPAERKPERRLDKGDALVVSEIVRRIKQQARDEIFGAGATSFETPAVAGSSG
jgi:hypothetical protein